MGQRAYLMALTALFVVRVAFNRAKHALVGGDDQAGMVPIVRGLAPDKNPARSRLRPRTVGAGEEDVLCLGVVRQVIAGLT